MCFGFLSSGLSSHDEELEVRQGRDTMLAGPGADRRRVGLLLFLVSGRRFLS